jgi:hypothetical protein
MAIIGAIVLTGLGCVQEDFDRCPRATRVYFSFARETSFGGVRSEETIGRIDLYAFDEAGKIAGYWVDDQVAMNENYYIEIDSLAAGNYHLVAWTNLGTRYVANVQPGDRQPSREEMNISLALPADRTLRDLSLPHLYFGECRGASVGTFGEERLVVVLEDNLYKLNFEVEGIEPSDDTYQFTVTDNNGAYTFANNYGEMPAFRYASSARFNGTDPLSASMTVLRLDENRTPALTFTNETSGQVLFSHDNLVNLILQANTQGATIDFRATREFYIKLRVHADASVTITINGWELETEEVQVS